uniref:CitMHS domain-containing protein n=1 Tax=Meloidogyne hapla TaxID=6305 RepID=A0A1I8BSH8_MELHA
MSKSEGSSEANKIQSLAMLTPKIKEMVRLRSLRRFFMFFLVPIVFSPIPLIIGTPPASCAYVIFVMGFFWVTETLPLPVTALIPTIAYPLLSIESAEVVSSAYLNDSNMMFFGSMVMAVAVESSRLHERVALRTLRFTGANPRFLMLGLQVATAFISLWMSNTSTTTMMVCYFSLLLINPLLKLPLVLALIKELDMCDRLENEQSLNSSKDSVDTISQMMVLSENKQQRRIYKGLLLSIAYASAIGGAGSTLIGTSSVISMNSHFQSKNDKKNNQIINDMIVKKYKELGPMRYEEVTVLISFLSLITLWLSRPAWSKMFSANYVTDGTASMLISMLLFVLPAENPFSSETVERLVDNKDEPIRTVITWKLMREKFSWSTLFLLGGGFAMALGVKKSGLSEWISVKLSAMQWLPPWAFISFSSGIVCMLTEFASNTATAAVFIPVVASIAIAQNMNPLVYVLPIIGGLVLKIGSFILCQVFAQTFAPLVFDFDSLNVSVSVTTMSP